MKKKAYSSPAVKELTPEQAKQLIAERRNWSEEQAAEFLESLRRQQHEPKKPNAKCLGWAGGCFDGELRAFSC